VFFILAMSLFAGLTFKQGWFNVGYFM